MDYASLYTSSFSGAEQDLRLRVERRLSASPFLARPLRRLGYNSAEEWAWDEYKSTVMALVEECRDSGRHAGGAVRLMEVGGGRSPLLSPAEAAEAGIELTVNDVDAGELARAPEAFEKAQFDIAGEIHSSWEGSFDLIISRMVFEHVRDAPRGWANQAAPAGAGRRRLRFPSDALCAAVPHQLADAGKAERREASALVARPPRRRAEVSRPLRNVFLRPGQGRADFEGLRIFRGARRAILAAQLFPLASRAARTRRRRCRISRRSAIGGCSRPTPIRSRGAEAAGFPRVGLTRRQPQSAMKRDLGCAWR